MNKKADKPGYIHPKYLLGVQDSKMMETTAAQPAKPVLYVV
jgi:hypothetical protein